MDGVTAGCCCMAHRARRGCPLLLHACPSPTPLQPWHRRGCRRRRLGAGRRAGSSLGEHAVLVGMGHQCYAGSGVHLPQPRRGGRALLHRAPHVPRHGGEALGASVCMCVRACVCECVRALCPRPHVAPPSFLTLLPASICITSTRATSPPGSWQASPRAPPTTLAVARCWAGTFRTAQGGQGPRGCRWMAPRQ